MDDRITGVMIYYYFVCKRKLWYFCHDIRMETENEDVILGKILDESSYKKKDKHINIDDIINIDFISEHKELHEVKKSKAVEEAGIWQVKYYLYYLQKRGDIEILERIILEITEIKHTDIPPICENSKLCKKCAYFDLCII